MKLPHLQSNQQKRSETGENKKCLIFFSAAYFEKKSKENIVLLVIFYIRPSNVWQVEQGMENKINKFRMTNGSISSSVWHWRCSSLTDKNKNRKRILAKQRWPWCCLQTLGNKNLMSFIEPKSDMLLISARTPLLPAEPWPIVALCLGSRNPNRVYIVREVCVYMCVCVVYLLRKTLASPFLTSPMRNDRLYTEEETDFI